MADVHLPVNLGNPVEMTIRQLAEAVNRLTSNPAGLTFLPEHRAPADPQRRQPDIRRAHEWLEWEPKTDLEPGLRRTIEDFRARL
jgi:nucleoside-diphosphate-sugar epimerase